MPSWLPSIAYPPSGKGFWDPVTSTINWCEEDYYATVYSAEIVNTLTNLLFISLGVKGIRDCVRYGYDNVFIVAFAGYLLVGSGSFAFHSTLKYPMQLVDELSMIYTACLMCYVTFSFSRSRMFCAVLGTGLASLAAFITIYYHFLQDPVFHQVAFALITATVLFRSMYIMEVNIRPSFRKKYATIRPKDNTDILSRSEQAAIAIRDKKIIIEMWQMVGFGLSVFLGGFAIWGLDQKFCSNLRSWRHAIGLPWGIFLEGHAWWHLMTGIGSYYYIVWTIWLRICLGEGQDSYKLNWKHLWSIPTVVPIEKKAMSSRDGNSYGTFSRASSEESEGSERSEDRKSV